MPSASTGNIDPMGIIRPAADGLIALAIVSAMSSSFSTMGAAAGFGGFSSPHEELDSLNRRIRQLSHRLEGQREAVSGTRTYKAKLMQGYGLSVLPSVVEMGKYPKLRATDYYLRMAEQDLDHMELRMLRMQKRRKELMVALGVREGEEEARRIYPAVKKFIEPRRRD